MCPKLKGTAQETLNAADELTPYFNKIKMKVTWSFVAVLAYAVFSNTADAAISAWTTPTIASKDGAGTLTVSETQTTGETITTYAATTNATSIAYTLVTAVSPFSLTTSGVLTITANLDADSTANYTLEIKAVDSTAVTADSGTATIMVTVTDVDEAPEFNQSFYVQCIANGSAADTTVITVLATDQDPDDTVVHSIEAAGNTNTDFKIDGSTGVIQVNTGKTLDLWTTPIYTLVVNAVDDDTPALTGSTTVMVKVTANGTCISSAAAVTFGFMTISMALVVTL